MKQRYWSRTAALLLGASLCLTTISKAHAGESSMPDSAKEIIKPELAAKYQYTEDGQYTKTLGIPTYEWAPVGAPPRVVVLAIHGLTLHGRTFRVLARTLAVNGADVVSMDMNGFGRCKFDPDNLFSTKDNDRTKVNHEKSYEEIVKLATLIKQRYPDLRLIVMGESLGCTFCVKLAAEHPDLVAGVIMSAPAVDLNKDLYGGEGQVRQGLKAVFKPSHDVNMSGFFAELCSKRPEVQEEMMADPLILKELPIGALISTDEFVHGTAKWGKGTSPGLAVLILQGSADGCVSPKHVTDLMNNMQSDDQTLAWRGNFGHLQLETRNMRIATINAIANWLAEHGPDRLLKQEHVRQDVADLGGTVTK